MKIRFANLIRFLFFISLGIPAVVSAAEKTVADLKADYLELRRDIDRPPALFQGRYLIQLGTLAEEAQEEGDLDLALAVDLEKKGFNEGTPAAKYPKLRELQVGYARKMAGLLAERQAAGIHLLRGYRSQLVEKRDGLTREGKLSEAQEVQTALRAVESELKEAIQSPPTLMADAVTSGRPFRNTLGMELVPVPITGGVTDTFKTGTRVLMSRWETRVKDYVVFAESDAETAGLKWKGVAVNGHGQAEDHPVVNVSWTQANAFCDWLTKRERSRGVILKNQFYRLPSDHEWSCAIGIGRLEDANATPVEKNGKIDVFPWGRGAPARPVGNYADITAGKAGVKPDGRWAGSYDDGHAFTAPVGSFPANGIGLHDLGGNVSEWCADSYGTVNKVLRGGSWFNYQNKVLLSSFRHDFAPSMQMNHSGFRCVLEAGGGGGG